MERRQTIGEKAKPCRSAARFLTLFCFSPIDPLRGQNGPMTSIGPLQYGYRGNLVPKVNREKQKLNRAGVLHGS